MSSSHTKVVNSRFNPGFMLAPRDQFAVLYFAANGTNALFEYGAMLGQPYNPSKQAPNPSMSGALLNVDVLLQTIVDLTDAANCNVLDTTAQELTGDWAGYQLRGMVSGYKLKSPTGAAPTQELGRALNATKVEGFLTVSAKAPGHANLIVFPDNIQSGSYLRFYDGLTLVHEIKK